MFTYATSHVAPFAGAWIEIASASGVSRCAYVAPFAGAWIEIQGVFPGRQVCVTVAPFAGAWIEMLMGLNVGLNKVASLPSRERGLKYHS